MRHLQAGRRNAPSVLCLSSKKHSPETNAPALALEALQQWKKGQLHMVEVRKFAFAAHKAARETKSEVAQFAARSCGHAAATAHVATHALHAAVYELKAIGCRRQDLQDVCERQLASLTGLVPGS